MLLLSVIDLLEKSDDVDDAFDYAGNSNVNGVGDSIPGVLCICVYLLHVFHVEMEHHVPTRDQDFKYRLYGI